MSARGAAALALVAAIVLFTAPGRAYTLLGRSWGSGNTVTMHMQMGSSTQSLIDGATSWNAVGESALAAWNGNANIAFGIIRNSTSSTAWRNSINNVYFSRTTPTGDDFGDALAVTQSSYTPSTGRTTESDVSFDSSLSWNSYRGNLRTSGGGRLYDVYRVAVHEFGHVLGLDHPDEAGQTRTAIMNSRTSNTDRLQSDDIQGLIAIYGSGSPSSSNPGSSTGSNRTPSVTASCNPCTVAPGGSSSLSASASDPDGDSLSYSWTVSAGSVSNGTSASATWTAPSTATTVTATITVTDSRGGSASSSVSITVQVSNTIRAGGRLLAGQSINSANNQYRLVYQSDGNLVLYDAVAGVALWASGTTGAPGQMALQGDGNFVIYSAGNAAVWFSGTAGNTGASLVLQNDGNLVLYSQNGTAVWWYALGGTSVPIPGGLTTIGGCVVTAMAVGQPISISGALTTTDCAAPSRSGSRGDVYVLTAAAGQRLTITLATTAFDAFLNLVGPDGLVGSDDDSAGGTSARIQYTVSTGGVYRIEATAFSPTGLGAYTLTVN